VVARDWTLVIPTVVQSLYLLSYLPLISLSN
jgi:hypothetical protein